MTPKSRDEECERLEGSARAGGDCSSPQAGLGRKQPLGDPALPDLPGARNLTVVPTCRLVESQASVRNVFNAKRQRLARRQFVFSAFQ